MTATHLISTSFVFIYLFLLINFASSSKCIEPCPIRVKCSTEENVVWAIDGNRCLVFRNPCHLFSENCKRLNRHEDALHEVSKTECQKRCPDVCITLYKPVCAVYNGVPKTFSNSCALDVHVCKTGETYEFLKKGDCQADGNRLGSPTSV